ncbi:MAG: MFS transporter, partial [Candidatus Thorarchaeota archaeon]
MTDTIHENRASYPVITLSLMLSQFLSGFPVMLLSLFIADIAQLFQLEIGVIGFVRSVAEVGSVIMGLLLGGLSVRYHQRSLLLVGIAIMCVSTLALGFIAVFPLFIVLFACFGLSRVMLRSMSTALIGHFFTVDQRPKVAAYLTAGMAVAYTVGSVLAAQSIDFRSVSLLVLFPLSSIALVLVWKGMPVRGSLVQQNP